MTYFGFLLRFLFLPILAFFAITLWNNRNNKHTGDFKSGRAVWIAIGIHVLLAVMYTTPWDNYLVATSVWYYNPNLVSGLIIGYVPIEEYTFFIVETILAGLWWWFLVRRITFIAGFDYGLRPPLSAREFKPNKLLVYLSIRILILLWLLFTYLFFFGTARWTYLSIILFWALPAIIVQFFFGADILWYYRKLVVPAILVPAIYLSLIDMVALKDTTWSISPLQTTGILFFGILPLEEVIFFVITNMLITFGMTLLLANVSQERFAEIKKQVQAYLECSRRRQEKQVPDPQSH